MNHKPPPDRRTFANAWDEIGYLRDKLLYWLYHRADVRKALTYALRLGPLLRKAAPDHDAILGEECWSLIHETRRDMPAAIEARENEIRLIRRLHELSAGMPHEATALKDYGYDDLSDRLDLLAVLYHDSGDPDKAIATLRESAKLCRQHGMEFDSDDLLREYLRDRKNARQPAAG